MFFLFRTLKVAKRLSKTSSYLKRNKIAIFSDVLQNNISRNYVGGPAFSRYFSLRYGTGFSEDFNYLLGTWDAENQTVC